MRVLAGNDDAPVTHVEARSGVAGAHIMLGNCLKARWMEIKSADAAPQPFDFRQPELDTSGFDVEESVAAGVFGEKAKLQLVKKKGLPKDGARPTTLFPERCKSFLAPFAPWVEGGGIFAFCDIAPMPRAPKTAGEVIEVRRRQANQYLACTRSVLDSGYTSTKHLAARAGGADALVVLAAVVRAPELFAAVATTNGIFDAASPSAGPLPDAAPHTASREEFGGSVPYLDVGSRPLPPFLLEAWIDNGRVLQSVKLAAKLQANAPDRIAAVFVGARYTDDGHSGVLGVGQIEANAEAFLLWALEQRGREALPVFSREAPLPIQHPSP